MVNKILYTQYIPAGARNISAEDEQKRVDSSASINTDFGDVAETGSNPGTRPIRGTYRGEDAHKMARELVELAQATNYGQVPYYTDDNNPLDDEYVTVNNFTNERDDPRTDTLIRFNGQLTKAGTPQSHFRSVQTTPVDVSTENPYSAAGTDLISLPSTATQVSWYDETGAQEEAATSQGTLNGEFIDVETYSPDEPTFDNPTLIAKVPMSDEGKADARIWDDYDNASKLDGNSNVQWQKVFTTGHVFNGNIVIENGLLRITLDEDNNSITVEEWNDSTQSYDNVAFGNSDYQPDRVNITRISPSRVEGQVRFEEVATPSNKQRMDFQVNRAADRILWTVPTNETAPVAGFDTYLSPTALDWDTDAQTVQKIIARKEVNF